MGLNPIAVPPGIDLSLILTPAATLRPGAAQTCQVEQNHGLESGLDIPDLIGACASALTDDSTPPQPVYYETVVMNSNRWPLSGVILGSSAHGWLLHNLVEANFDLFRYLLLGNQLKPWGLHPLVKLALTHYTLKAYCIL